MPKVKFLVDVSGAWAKNTIADVSDEVADAWCDGERAERVIEDPKAKRSK